MTVPTSGPTPDPGEFHPLSPCLDALKRGDWRTAVIRLHSDGSSQQKLAAAANLLARSMFWQAMGDVEAAWAHLDDVARMLPPTLTRYDQAEPTCLVKPPWAGSTGPGSNPPMWMVCLLTWREQTELISLRERFRRPGRSPRDELIDACIEYLIWVEFDPATWQAPRNDTGLRDLGLIVPPTFATPRRMDLCDRASALRKLAVPTLGDLSESVWKDIGGYRGLKAQALRRMADRPLTAWKHGVAAPEPVVPVRIARAQAWTLAQDWFNPG
jgi:hypothetical protein